MSRYKAPGTVIAAWDDEGAQVALVVATSRHKHRMDLGDAVAVLAVEAIHFSFAAWTSREDYEAAVETAADVIRTREPMRWRSVTQAEVDQGEHWDCCRDDECDPGDWCSGGHGAAWMDVLYAPLTAITAAVAAAGEQTPEGRQQ